MCQAGVPHTTKVASIQNVRFSTTLLLSNIYDEMTFYRNLGDLVITKYKKKV